MRILEDKAFKGYGSIRHQAKLRFEKRGMAKNRCGDKRMELTDIQNQGILARMFTPDGTILILRLHVCQGK